MTKDKTLEIISLQCPTCGGGIVWCGENDVPDGRVENTYRCDRCGTTFTSLEPTEEDKFNDYADYWNGNGDDLLECNRIYNEDCLKGIKKIGKDSISLIITDPPYAISRDSNYAKSKPTGKDTDRFRISIDFGEWDQPDAFDIKKMIKESYRCLKDGGYIVCFYDLWKINIVKEAMEEAGFNQLRLIEWQKTNPVPINSKINYLTNAKEFAVCAVKGSSPIFKSEYDNGVYSYPICHEKDRFHPTQKPVDLIREIIAKHSNEGDLVLDNCMGSGTTAIACIREKRNFIGFELNKEYYDKACKRIQLEMMQPSLF